MVWRTTASILALMGVALSPLTAAEITLLSEAVELTFDTDAGGALCGLRNVPCDVSFTPPLETPLEDRSPWLLVVRRSDGTLRQATARDAARISRKLAGRSLELTWEGVRLGDDAGELRVTMTVLLLPVDGKSRWELAVEGEADGVLWDVQFPRLLGLKAPPADELALPKYWGRLVRDPVGSGTEVTLEYPQPASMQWLAWWGGPAPASQAAESATAGSAWQSDRRDAAGLYLAAEDGDGWHKRFAVSSRAVPGRLSFWVHHLPALDEWPPAPGRRPVNYSLPYPVVLTAFRGDYHEAAAFYRDWARRRAWCRRGPMAAWPAAPPAPGSPEEAVWVPAWFRQVGFWAKLYHEPAKVLPELAAYRAWLRVPMAVHYYRGTVAPFDDDYPEPLPADPYLTPGALAARRIGAPLLPYTNAMIWDTDTQSWLREDGLAAAIKDEQGRMVPWNIGTEVFAHMCPVEKLRAKVRDTTRKVVGEHAAAGVYLDCLAAVRAMPCYDPRHRHPVHGGDHRARDLRRLLEELRLDARRLVPEAAFFTEEIGEQFLDLCDGFLTLDFTRAALGRGERVFPLFSVVYHPYALNFGSDARLDSDPSWFALEMGTLFTWGTVPLLSAQVAVPPREGDPNSELLRELAQACCRAGTPFLQEGQWERLVTAPESGTRPAGPLALTCRPHAASCTPPGRPRRPWEGPSVLGSAWRQGNAVGVVLVNITTEPQTASVWADAAALGLPAGCEIASLWPDVAANPLGPEGVFQVTLGPRKAAIAALGPPGRVWRRQALDECPWRLLAATDGPLEETTEQDGFLWACDDGPVVHQFSAQGAVLTAAAIDEQGVLVRRVGRQAESRGPAAEGRGLPRRRLEQPFSLLRRLPHRAVGGEPRVTVLGGAEDWLLCRVNGACRMVFPREGLVCRPGADGAGPSLAVADSVELPAGQGETVVAYWAPGPAPGGTLAERARACGTAAAEAETVRVAAAALAETPSPEALSLLSRALAVCLEASARTPAMAAPGSPLADLVRRCNAMVSGLTGMEAVLLAEDDWLTPGLPKTVTLISRGAGPGVQPRIAVLADVPAGSLDVTLMAAPPGARTLSAKVLLRREDYVERLVPVAAFLRASLGSHEFVLMPLLWLDSNRPVTVVGPPQEPVVCAGGKCTSQLTVRNVSPTEVSLAVNTTLPRGWTATVSPPELRLPALSDRTVEIALEAPPDARSGPVAVDVRLLWGSGQEQGFLSRIVCGVQERMALLRSEARAPVADASPSCLRGRNRVAFWVEAGEEVAVTVRNRPVARYTDSVAVRLVNPRSGEGPETRVPLGQEAVLKVTGAEAGLWVALIDAGNGSAEVDAGGKPMAELANEASPLSLFCSPVTRWFYVPRTGREFALCARDGGEDETALIRVTAPDGTVLLEEDGRWRAEPRRISVPKNAAGAVWRLECHPRQDVSLWLEGDVCPFLSTAPGAVPIPGAELAPP